MWDNNSWPRRIRKRSQRGVTILSSRPPHFAPWPFWRRSDEAGGIGVLFHVWGHAAAKARLEDELGGYALFRARCESRALTEAGKVFLTEARAVLQRTNEAVQMVRPLRTDSVRNPRAMHRR